MLRKIEGYASNGRRQSPEQRVRMWMQAFALVRTDQVHGTLCARHACRPFGTLQVMLEMTWFTGNTKEAAQYVIGFFEGFGHSLVPFAESYRDAHESLLCEFSAQDSKWLKTCCRVA